MSAFGGATRAETLKVLTTKMWWILAIVLVVYLGATATFTGIIMGVASSRETRRRCSSALRPT